MKVYQAGIRSVVALMGAVLHEAQYRTLVQRFRRAIVMLDGDSTGRKASAVIAAKLRLFCEVVGLPVGVQPDQLSTEQIQEILQPVLQRRLPVR
jgi:DNA primase